MQTEVTTKLRTKSLTEPCLLLGIGRNFLSCISCKITELPALSVNRESTLSETAELLTFTVHETLRNVMFTESLTEFSPSSDLADRVHSFKIFPPKTRRALEMIGSRSNLISFGYVGRM